MASSRKAASAAALTAFGMISRRNGTRPACRGRSIGSTGRGDSRAEWHRCIVRPRVCFLRRAHACPSLNTASPGLAFPSRRTSVERFGRRVGRAVTSRMPPAPSGQHGAPGLLVRARAVHAANWKILRYSRTALARPVVRLLRPFARSVVTVRQSQRRRQVDGHMVTEPLHGGSERTTTQNGPKGQAGSGIPLPYPDRLRNVVDRQ